MMFRMMFGMIFGTIWVVLGLLIAIVCGITHWEPGVTLVLITFCSIFSGIGFMFGISKEMD